MAVQPWIERNPLGDSVVMMDPPLHGGTRALVAHALLQAFPDDPLVGEEDAAALSAHQLTR